MSGVDAPPRPKGDRSSLLALAGVCGLLLFGAVCGFLLLPANRGGSFDAWATICRAVGLGGPRGTDGPVVQGTPASGVAWTSGEVLRATAGNPALGRNAALSCIGCHGAGIVAEQTLFPNLAGMDQLSFTKQMADYAADHRASVLMQAFASTLSSDEVADLAAFYASLPRPAGTGLPDPAGERLIALGDNARAMAPCASCHGANNRSPATPRLDGLSADYLAEQLDAWRTGRRSNDPYDVMGSVARALTPAEVSSVSTAYAAHRGKT